jgi:hypothetical protein
MMIRNASSTVLFVLRFYEQTADVILAVLESAQGSHPGIVGYTQASDWAASRPCTVVTLRFCDPESLSTFLKDDHFVDVYLANAWGRRALTREALRVKSPVGEAHEVIPSDLFVEVGL